MFIAGLRHSRHLTTAKRFRGRRLLIGKLDVPVGQIDEVFPRFVAGFAELEVQHGPPLGPARFVQELKAGLGRCAVALAAVAGDARADNVFPRSRTAAVPGNDVVKIQILAVKSLAAILAHVVIALENVVPGELDLLFGETVEHDEEDDAGDADFEGDSADAFRMRLLIGKVLPLVETESLEGTVLSIQNHLGVAFKKQSKGATRGADIDRLPQSVQDQHMLI